ncbi:trypsin-like serine protease [Pseudoalteromonas denitrificans]|uniref:Carbohydrate binding domain-containing protein n=1 Tax=Pseudoalteromonas denitrificans DSM 6059 TaxID=1123010 RepID=A0A1I1Q8S4_9GAMM|nr:trypsin-like serine protease [Pseudoalteromonas denitrificans]SFD18511.1 Carbohydrate binding domain-containing protein [Pseudoalteromonas denitrificans DSM 6059]
MIKKINKTGFAESKLSVALKCIAVMGTLGSSLAYSASDNDVTPQIVGGVESTPYSRPYQVALLMNGRQGCGGTLISSGWVLTAAHCLDSASTNSLTVKVGTHSLRSGDGETLAVSQIITHENWRGANGIRSGYDIGLLKLASSASSKYKPAKLPTKEIEDLFAGVGRDVTVSGWGLTRHQGSSSDTLREVNLPVISNASCSSQLQFNIPGSVICGGGTGGVSACNGDSGGPYAISTNGDFYSIGTVSWGNACQGATAFTRTTSYLDWIKTKTGIGGDENPIARFTSQINDRQVSFNNTSTDDIDIVSQQWRFGDNETSTVENPIHTYAKNGSYTVTLTVTDTIGQTGTTSSIVKIGGDVIGCDGIDAWNVAKSYQLNEVVSYQNKKYQATWWSTGAQPNVYSNVWNNIGDCSTNTENEAPVASFSVSTAALTASFSDASTDDHGIVSRLWDFDDGTSSASINPIHTYTNKGTYRVSLTVTDEQGLTNVFTQDVTVDESNQNGCQGIETWNASEVYLTGAQVALNGVKYTANWWNQGRNPEASGPWGVWTASGSCN